MGSLLNIGFGNMVNASKLIAVISPDSAPVKRLVQNSKDEGHVIDATQGRRTRAVLVMENDQLILSALLPETIANRCRGKDNAPEAEHDDSELLLTETKENSAKEN